MNEKEVAKKLREILDNSGMSWHRWAIKNNVNPSNLTFLFKGERPPSSDILRALNLTKKVSVTYE